MSEQQTVAEVAEPQEPIVIQQLRERFLDHILGVIDHRSEISVGDNTYASYEVLEFLKTDYNIS